MADYFNADGHWLLLLAAGIMALLAAIIPVILKKMHISAPIVYLAIGGIAFFVFGYHVVKPLQQLEEIKYITEFVILVALTNAGLRIKQPFKWATWKYSFRLLLIAMPLTIIAATFLGWWIMGFAPAAALLFGALISPTDPVLASELQTSDPGEEDTSKIKLGLTSEAGINDGLAFPFTWFAILFATNGPDYKEWLGEWFLHFFLLKIAIGVLAGLLTGWLLYKLVFTISTKNTIGRISRGILSLSLILLPYAVSEIIGGYGFLAVFFAACIFSDRERHHEHMNNLHDFNEELESFVVAIIFISTGVFIAMQYEFLFNLQIIAVSLLMVLVVRPLSGYISLAKTGLNHFQRFALSFYGMRGIGSMFYLAYALTAADFEGPKKLIGLTTATIFFSVLIHGITARSVQKRIKKYDSQHNDA
jgi:sodium/hydrogen antiporter